MVAELQILLLGFLLQVAVSDVTFINVLETWWIGCRLGDISAYGLRVPPSHAIEWAGDSVGVLKEWSGGTITDALDGSSVPYGEVSLAENNGTPQLAQVSQSVVPDDLVGSQPC